MTTAQQHCIETGTTLQMAMEVSQREWKLAFGVSVQGPIHQRTIRAGDFDKLRRLITHMKKLLGLSPRAGVRSCYEAGRDGFWIHRALIAEGIENILVDPASIQVNRRSKRAKTDRLDAAALVRLLVRHSSGEKQVWSVVHVITAGQEDARHLHREDIGLSSERTAIVNQMRGLLATVGAKLPERRHLAERLPLVKQWDGQLLGPDLLARLKRLYARLLLIEQQIQQLRSERERRLKHSDTPEVQAARQLLKLKGVGTRGAFLLAHEGISYRQFKNRREIAGFAGITPTPYQSGDTHREQGISKAGNRWMRWMIVELAWCWLQYQPDSGLSRWYRQKYSSSARLKKIGIVALGRKLLIALWRVATQDEIPTGAVTVDWRTKLSHHRRTAPDTAVTPSSPAKKVSRKPARQADELESRAM